MAWLGKRENAIRKRLQRKGRADNANETALRSCASENLRERSAGVNSRDSPGSGEVGPMAFEMEFASFPIWHFLENKSLSERRGGTRAEKEFPKRDGWFDAKMANILIYE
jgi:hypothetical protein